MDGTCDVPGCTNETFMGWRPLSEPLGKQICESHWNRHKDPADSFNLWDAFGFQRPANRPARPIRAEPSQYGCGRVLPFTKPIVKAEPEPHEQPKAEPPQDKPDRHEAERREPQAIPARENPSDCRACGAQREAGHTYCPKCSRERKAESNRRRQRRHYLKVQKPNAFVAELI